MDVKIKICGLCNEDDVRLAIQLGADALGFVFEQSSPRFVRPEDRRQLTGLGFSLEKTAVFGNYCAFDAELPIHRIQSLDRPNRYLPWSAALRLGPTDWEAAEAPAGADRVVLDAFVPGQFGGTGKTLDWERAAEFVRRCPVPVVLAGGLTPDNVAEAIERVRPAWVDVSSGIESAPGRKDPARMQRFFEAVRAART